MDQPTQDVFFPPVPAPNMGPTKIEPGPGFRRAQPKSKFFLPGLEERIGARWNYKDMTNQATKKKRERESRRTRQLINLVGIEFIDGNVVTFVIGYAIGGAYFLYFYKIPFPLHCDMVWYAPE